MNALIERLARVPRFARFALVGGAGFVVNSAALWIAMNLLGAGRYAAWFVAFVPAVTFTWWGNRNLTFQEHKRRDLAGAVREWAKFVATNSVGALVNYATYAAFATWAPVPANNPYAALAAGVLAGMVFNFTLSKKLVFKAPPAP